jgi:hypothetical protein
MNCLASQITFDTAALELLVNEPAAVLKDPEAFWTSHRAQLLTRRWMKMVGYKFSPEDWRNEVAAWARLTPAGRREHALVKMCDEIVRARESFARLALGHLCSFAAAETDLSCTIRFTAFIPPNAFAVEDIVVNVGHRSWRGNPDNVLNTMVHEVGHVVHSGFRELGGWDKNREGRWLKTLDNLQAEGFCTYLGFRAQEIYPAPDVTDYVLAADHAAVERLFGDLRLILAAARDETITADDFSRLSWDKGVKGRAYYVAGMRMCQAIDERMGRDALLQSILAGPPAWLELARQLLPKELGA